MRLLETLVKTHLTQSTGGNATAVGDHVSDGTDENSANTVLKDPLETATPYRRWAVGFRLMTRLRYLALKVGLYTESRETLQYELTPTDVHGVLDKRLSTELGGFPVWRILARPWIAYPVVLMAVVAIGVLLVGHHKQRDLDSLFRNDIPQWSDLIYQQKVAAIREDKAADSASAMTQIADEAKVLRESIQERLAPYPTVVTALESLFDRVATSDAIDLSMHERVKPVNDALYEYGLPYYLSTVSEVSSCEDLLPERFISRLFGSPPAEGETCVTHAVLSFKVNETRLYSDSRNDHLAFFTRRLDGLIIQEDVLGRVHIGDNSAQILLSNIENAGDDSRTAVRDGQLKTRLVPDGMPDVYGLESIARRLQSTLINDYADELNQRVINRVKRVFGDIIGEPVDSLTLAVNQLNSRLADITAYHEVQHLVDQRENLAKPDWFDAAIKPFGSRLAAEQMQEHVLWELSAFFTHMAYAEELSGVLLNDLAAITLNPMLQSQPHYYSLRLFLQILYEQQQGQLDRVITPATSLGDVARAYKSLAANHQQLPELSRQSYRLLFDRDIPVLTLK